MIWRTPKYTGPERRQKPRWRPRPLRVLLSLLIFVVASYAIVVFWLIAQESQLVSRASQSLPPERPEFPWEQIDIPRSDRAAQFAWAMRGRPDGMWVVFLHGNPATVASRVSISRYRVLRNADLNVLAPEYRGFGGLDGVATEASLTEDARAAYDYLRATRRVAESHIVIYGWSLGAMVAANVASDVTPRAVVLEGAPASLVDLVQGRYPFFPIRLLMRPQFEVISRVGRIRAPLLFLHSPDDVVVPIAEGRRLFGAARAEKEFVEVRGGHLDAPEIDAARFSSTIAQFIDGHQKVATSAGRQ